MCQPLSYARFCVLRVPYVARRTHSISAACKSLLHAGQYENVKWVHSMVFRVVTCVVLWDTDVTEESAASIFMVEIEVFALQACISITFVFCLLTLGINCRSPPEWSGNSRGMLGPIRCPETSVRSYQVRCITFRSEWISDTSWRKPEISPGSSRLKHDYGGRKFLRNTDTQMHVDTVL